MTNGFKSWSSSLTFVETPVDTGRGDCTVCRLKSWGSHTIVCPVEVCVIGTEQSMFCDKPLNPVIICPLTKLFISTYTIDGVVVNVSVNVTSTGVTAATDGAVEMLLLPTVNSALFAELTSILYLELIRMYTDESTGIVFYCWTHNFLWLFSVQTSL